MRLFWELSKLAFQRQLTYRAATLAGLATNFFFGMLRASVIIALFHGNSEIAGMTITGCEEQEISDETHLCRGTVPLTLGIASLAQMLCIGIVLMLASNVIVLPAIVV